MLTDKMDLSKLSNDEITQILIAMPITLVMNMASGNRKIYNLTSSNYFWCERLINDFNVSNVKDCKEEYKRLYKEFKESSYSDLIDAIERNNISEVKRLIRLGLELDIEIVTEDKVVNPKDFIESCDMLELFIDQGVTFKERSPIVKNAFHRYNGNELIQCLSDNGYSYDNLTEDIIEDIHDHLSHSLTYAISILPMNYFKKSIDKVDSRFRNMIIEDLIGYNQIDKVEYLRSIGWDILNIENYDINTLAMAKYLKSLGLDFSKAYTLYETENDSYRMKSLIDNLIDNENQDKELYKYLIDQGVDPTPSISNYLFEEKDPRMEYDYTIMENIIQFIINTYHYKLKDIVDNKSKYRILKSLCKFQ